MLRIDPLSPSPSLPPGFDPGDTDGEFHTSSLLAHLLDELQLCGHRPGEDEPDQRPLPEPDELCGHLDVAVEALCSMLTGTRL